jgi:hypothetical protein
MATLYFNGAVDDDWNELGNWWTDASCASPYEAASLPGPADDVYFTNASNVTNSGDSITVANLFVATGGYTDFSAEVTVNGVATFSDSASLSGTVYGDCVFDQSAALAGTVYGNATFLDYAACNGSVYGAALVFNDYSNIGASFNANPSATAVTFNDYSAAHSFYAASDVESVEFNDFSAASSSDFAVQYPIVCTFSDMSVLGNYYYGRGEAGSGMSNLNVGDESVIIFRGNALLFASGLFSGPRFEFHDNAYNATGTPPYPDTNILRRPSRGINGSSILGVI